MRIELGTPIGPLAIELDAADIAAFGKAATDAYTALRSATVEHDKRLQETSAYPDTSIRYIAHTVPHKENHS